MKLTQDSVAGKPYACCVPMALTVHVKQSFDSWFTVALQGSFCKGTFAAYNVYDREIELSEVPLEGMEVG